MIIVIDAVNRDRFGALLADMFRLRARVFGDRLGWEVSVNDGMEVDRFDSLDPAYLVGLNDEGHVVSCARLLQTTGPHMLADVFSAILDGEPPLRSSRLWESTRFCVDTQRLKEGRGRNGIAQMTSEMIVGLLEYGKKSGISDIVTVIDPVMDRVLKRSACAPYDYVGSQKPMGRVAALAALIDCTDQRIQAVREFSGIEGEIFLSDLEALERFAMKDTVQANENILAFPARLRPEPQTTVVSTDDVLEYCLSQLRAAETFDERKKAGRVVREILGATGLSTQVLTLANVLESDLQAHVH